MSSTDKILKRLFDIICSFIGLILIWWLIFLIAFLAYIDTGQNGFFKQRRVGKNGKLFSVIKIRSMRPIKGVETTVTTENDPRISKFGSLLRKAKLDE